MSDIVPLIAACWGYFLILLQGQEKRKDRKSQKSWSEERVVGFSSASIFPARKWEAVTQSETI